MKKNLKFVEDIELYRCHVKHGEINLEHVERDMLRQGYWVDQDSKTMVILRLRGCRFNDFIHWFNQDLESRSSQP